MHQEVEQPVGDRAGDPLPAWLVSLGRVSLTVVSLMASAAALLGFPRPVAIAICLAFLTGTAMLFAADFGRLGRLPRVVLAVAAILLTLVGATATVLGDRVARRETPGRVGDAATWPIGVLHPTMVVTAGDALLVLGSGGVSKFDPRHPELGAARLEALPGPLKAIAGNGERFVVMRADGRAVVRSQATGRRLGAFSVESGGCLAVTKNAVWAGNAEQSKINRYDLRRRHLKRLPIPGPPELLLVAGDGVWASSESQEGLHYLSHFESATGEEISRFVVPERPTALAYGFGTLWVAYRSRLLVRLDPAAGGQVGQTVPLRSTAASLAVTPDGVVALLQSHDLVQLIDPERSTVVAEKKVLERPVDFVLAGGWLWVLGDGGVLQAVNPDLG